MSLQYESEEKRQITPEEFLAERKRAMRRRSWWAIGIGAALVAAHLILFAVLLSNPDEYDEILTWKDLFRSIFFILGLFAFVGGVWGLYEARRLRLEDLIPSPEAIDFARAAEQATPYYSYLIIGCLIAVTLCQMATGADNSVALAGLVKPDVWTKGEYWRILTGATLHGGLLHIYFNSQALYGFGSLIEFLANRAHLAIVFLLAIIGGSILSIVFMPEGRSVGASGGIMGLIGYLAIYGYRRKQQLPPDFLRSMMINIGFVAAFGLVAYQIIDNFAHLGGVLTGAVYGFLQIPRDLHKNPRNVGAVTEALGLIALGVFIFVSILSILLILQYVKF
jgi:membrane associated rhomboid family serine protease